MAYTGGMQAHLNMAYANIVEAEQVSQASSMLKPRQHKRSDEQAFSSVLSDGSTTCSDGLDDEVVSSSSLRDICKAHAPPVAPSSSEIISAALYHTEKWLPSQQQAGRACVPVPEISEQWERHTEHDVPQGEYQKTRKPFSSPLPVGLVKAYSRGSKNHALGMCRPCRSFNSPEGCSKGVGCNFCHCPHDDSTLQEVEQSVVKAAERRLRQEILIQINEQSSSLSHAMKADSRQSRSLVLDEPWYVPMPVSFTSA